VRALFHAFMEAFFELPCSCEAAEERRRAQPTRDPAPLVRRGRRPKAAASEPTSMDVGGAGAGGVAAEGMDVDGHEETGGKVGVCVASCWLLLNYLWGLLLWLLLLVAASHTGAGLLVGSLPAACLLLFLVLFLPPC
jgi:hypothetical protein